MYNLRNRSFLKEIDFTARELEHLLTLSAALKTVKYAGTEVPRLTGKNDCAHLREDLHPNALGVRGRGLRPRRPRHLPGPERLAARPQGVDRRHRSRARSHVRRDRVPRFRAERRRGAGRERRRPGLQRADRRVASHPDARRLPHDARIEPPALRRHHLHLHGRCSQQHRPLAVGDGSDHGLPTSGSADPGSSGRRPTSRPSPPSGPSRPVPGSR